MAWHGIIRFCITGEKHFQVLTNYIINLIFFKIKFILIFLEILKPIFSLAKTL
jgi:hypothetical protein